MHDDILVITDTIATSDIIALSERRFGDMVKGVVDVRLGVMALGGDLHADEEQVLLDHG